MNIQLSRDIISILQRKSSYFDVFKVNLGWEVPNLYSDIYNLLR